MNLPELFSLAGRVALVTGSTRGIGKAIASGLAEAGARVYVHGRDEREGTLVAQALGTRFLAADLARPREVERLVAKFSADEQRLDVLVNNAGIEVPTTLEALTPELLERINQVNFSASVQLTRLLLPLLRRSDHAAVINVTSIHDHIPYKGNAAYCSAKAALAMFTRSAAVELAAQGIRVNTLAPGAIETDMNRDVLDEIGRDRFADWIPLGRVGREDEMVGPAVFLASRAASYVTGATLIADGAYSQHLIRYDLIDEAPREVEPSLLEEAPR